MLGRFVGRLVVCGFRGPWIGSAKNLFVDESGLEGLVGLTGLTTLGIFTTVIVFEEGPGLVAIFLMLDKDPEIEYIRVKLGIFGQTAKFRQRPCLFLISNIGIKN